jgi:hypothetical protein
MNLDSDDLQAFAEAGRLEEVVLHEMGHVLGIGSLWEGLGFVEAPADGSGAHDSAFNGASARAAFDEVGGDAYQGGAKVPVENLGSEGEINGHWREAALGSELMTTRMGSSTAALSIVTIASLEDLGYQVSYDAADSYSWPSEDGVFSLRTVGAPPAPSIDLSSDQLAIVLLEVTDDGLLRPVGD